MSAATKRMEAPHSINLNSIADAALRSRNGNYDAAWSFLEKRWRDSEVAELWRRFPGMTYDNAKRAWLRERAVAIGIMKEEKKIVAFVATTGRQHASLDSKRTAQTIIARCILDTLMVNGQPIRLCVGQEAIAWGERQSYFGKVAVALGRAVPATGRIGDHISDKRANAIAQGCEAGND